MKNKCSDNLKKAIMKRLGKKDHDEPMAKARPARFFQDSRILRVPEREGDLRKSITGLGQKRYSL